MVTAEITNNRAWLCGEERQRGVFGKNQLEKRPERKRMVKGRPQGDALEGEGPISIFL